MHIEFDITVTQSTTNPVMEWKTQFLLVVNTIETVTARMFLARKRLRKIMESALCVNV